MSVQRIVNSLESEGIISRRTHGSTRDVFFNSTLYGVDELRLFLNKYAKRMPELEQAVEALRRRPRRSEKPL